MHSFSGDSLISPRTLFFSFFEIVQSLSSNSSSTKNIDSLSAKDCLSASFRSLSVISYEMLINSTKQ